MRITAVDPESPLFGRVRPGDRLARINGENVLDNLDCLYKLAEDMIRLEFVDTKGRLLEIRIDNPPDLGLTFESDQIRRCRNKCIFCFVHQQPKGMRKSLYVRDDDYRLSFTHGNFISLSNLSGDDMSRIVEQRLTPLYVSVHTTDDTLRRAMFRNKNLPPVIPQLKRLCEQGISFHTQVVVCPGVNDGRHLEKTVNDLFGLYPQVKTLGIVPVGLTRYRRNLFKLKPFDGNGAGEIVNYVHTLQRDFRKECGSRFMFAADEFYILAGRDFPRLSEYEEMEQFENGIGMMRSFLADFSRRKKVLDRLRRKTRIVLLTSESAAGPIDRHVIGYLKKAGWRIEILSVQNRFWGRNITVSGLLTGRDLLNSLRKTGRKFDIVLLPPNCLSNDDLFLDDMSLEEFRKKARTEVGVGRYSIIDTLKEVSN